MATKAELRRALFDLRQRIMDGYSDIECCEKCGAPLFEDEDYCREDVVMCWPAATGIEVYGPCFSWRMVEEDGAATEWDKPELERTETSAAWARLRLPEDVG